MKITIQSKSGELQFDCGSDEKILHAGLRQGHTLPYECATGTCGTCRARVMTGAVDMGWKEAPGYARLKQDKGDILMCQTRAKTDCLLRVPSDIASVDPTLPDSRLPARRRGAVVNRRKLTSDVIHFEVELESPMTFEAGQFVVLETPDLSGARAYSMVNFQPAVDRIALVLKRKPGGRFSDWLSDTARDNAEVVVFGPLGRAVFRPEEGKNLLCIAGGSGIAGMMSMLERAVQADYFRDHKGWVFFGVRTTADMFYLEELARHVAASHDNLDVTVALSHEAAARVHERFPSLKLASGMVHEVATQAMAGRYDDAIVYIAGPPPMVDGAIRALISGGGLSARQIRYDKFG